MSFFKLWSILCLLLQPGEETEDEAIGQLYLEPTDEEQIVIRGGLAIDDLKESTIEALEKLGVTWDEQGYWVVVCAITQS